MKNPDKYFYVHPLYSSSLPYKLGDALSTSGKTSKTPVTVVGSGKGDWEVRAQVGGELMFYCTFFLYIVYLEHQKSRIWCVETGNSREVATDSGPKTWW